MPKEIPEIQTEKDTPIGVGGVLNVEKMKHQHNKEKHNWTIENYIVIGGLALILLFTIGEFILVIKNPESEYIKAFFNSVGSAIMLILGYLFGSRKN